MAFCQICKNFYPPGFTELIPDTKFYKCKFCEQGKDTIMSVNKVDNGIHWDVKKDIIAEYKAYLNKIIHDKKAKINLLKGI